MKPGIYSDISNEDYHSGPGVSKSQLDLFHKAPAVYKASIDGLLTREPTAQQALGTAFHCLILEPERFTQEYCLALRRSDVPDAIDDREVLVEMIGKLNETRLPKLSTSGKKEDQVARIMVEIATGDAEKDAAYLAELEAMKGTDLKLQLEAMNADRPGKLSISGSRHELADILRANGQPVTLWSDVLAEWTENNPGRTILSPEQWDQLHAMRDGLMKNSTAVKLLYSKSGGKAEQSIYWIDKTTGQLCRIRPDWLRSNWMPVDLKTAADASEEGFKKSVAQWRYDVQEAMYLSGIEAHTGKRPACMPFVVVETKPPYLCAVYTLGGTYTAIGNGQLREDLDNLAQCVSSDIWPGYSDEAVEIEAPGYHITKNIKFIEQQEQ